MIKAVFFDAVGTLIRLTKSVGENYALVGRQIGLHLDARELDHAFARVWKEMPARPAIEQPREQDDKNWWREFVRRMLQRAAPALALLDRDAFFEAAYDHFAQDGVWELYSDVRPTLEALAPQFQLAILSNFDGRLRTIARGLTIAKYFSHCFLSSEIGADKPDLKIYQRALAQIGFAADEVMHVGDDPERDWRAAAAAGLETFRLERPRNSLGELPALLRAGSNYRKS